MISSSYNLFHSTTCTGTTTLSGILLISLCLFVPSNATETDLLALLSFKSLIWNDPSRALSSWNASLHHCQWPGVICGRRHPDRVTGLALDSFQLASQISPSLGNLTFLQRLSLSNNHLSGNIPEELGQLRRLRYLNLSTNYIHGSIPSALGNNCSNLEYLNLRSNNLRGTIHSSIGQCRNEEGLNFEDSTYFGKPWLDLLLG